MTRAHRPHRAKKSLGQHFLRCDWVIGELLATARVSPADTIVEIGPGTGALTRALASRASRVIAIEKDEMLAEALARALRQEGIDNVSVIPADILDVLRPKHKHPSLPKIPSPYKIVANIPYYITGRLLRLLLERENRPQMIALTLQKEVARRIIAEPPRLNMLALAVQAFGTPRLIKTVPASCFVPAPRVVSAILAIERISDAFFTRHDLDPLYFFSVARGAFQHPRKTLVNALAPGIEKQKALEFLASLNLSPAIRPSNLTLAQWAFMVQRVAAIRPPPTTQET